MGFAGFKRLARPAWAVAAVGGLIAGPAFAFGAAGFGGFHGGFHGAFHGGLRTSGFHAPPAIGAPAPRPPFTRPFPPIGFPGHDHFFHDRFHGRFHNGNGAWGWGGWGWGWGWGGYGTYATGEAQPVYYAQAQQQAAEPPPCPELLTWSPKLGRATRQRLCDDSAATRSRG